MGEAALSGVLVWPAPKLPVNLYGLREGGGGSIEGRIWYRLHRFCIILFSHWAPWTLPYESTHSPVHRIHILTNISIVILIVHSVSPAKELSSTNEKKSSNGLSPPSESNEIFRFYDRTKMLTMVVLMWIGVEYAHSRYYSL